MLTQLYHPIVYLTDVPLTSRATYSDYHRVLPPSHRPIPMADSPTNYRPLQLPSSSTQSLPCGESSPFSELCVEQFSHISRSSSPNVFAAATSAPPQLLGPPPLPTPSQATGSTPTPPPAPPPLHVPIPVPVPSPVPTSCHVPVSSLAPVPSSNPTSAPVMAPATRSAVATSPDPSILCYIEGFSPTNSFPTSPTHVANDDAVVDHIISNCFQTKSPSPCTEQNELSLDDMNLGPVSMGEICGPSAADPTGVIVEIEVAAGVHRSYDEAYAGAYAALTSGGEASTGHSKAGTTGTGCSSQSSGNPGRTGEVGTSNSGGRVRKRGKEKRVRAPARAWSVEEHRRFEESLELYGRDWERCASYIGTRSAQLVRSHAQKHLIKLWKLGLPLPKKMAESGTGYTLSGKPLLPESASARSYLTKIPCPPSSEVAKQ